MIGMARNNPSSKNLKLKNIIIGSPVTPPYADFWFIFLAQTAKDVNEQAKYDDVIGDVITF